MNMKAIIKTNNGHKMGRRGYLDKGHNPLVRTKDKGGPKQRVTEHNTSSKGEENETK